MKIPVYFHENQLAFHPPYEWDKRGYAPHPENPERVRAILSALEEAPEDFELRQPGEIPIHALQQVHSSDLLRLYHLAEEMPEEEFFFPTFFPKHHQKKSDPDNIHHAGFYCFDTSTPLSRDTFTAAGWSAASAHAAAECLASGETALAYALTRPPGHHADRTYFGGYCYFNNAAVGATVLLRQGTVCIVDIDFHHGDGTQSIYYYDNHVLTCSLHAHPREHFPYFSGHPDEIGLGAGEGFNLNVALESGTGGDEFMQALTEIVIPRIRAFDPMWLIIGAGMDTYKYDPICDFQLETDDYRRIGHALGELPYPTLVVQEGGYYIPDLGHNIKTLLYGLREGKATS